MDTVVTFRNEALLGTDLVTDVSRLLVDAGSSINDVRELVIADAGIEDVDLLLGQLEPGTDLWRVDSQTDMASMFSAALSGAYTRLHVLGHGQPGSVTLGGRALQVEDFTALSRGNVVVQSMHFWSCMTGAGIKGRAFVDGIAQAFGAFVTAFSGLVGAASKGGGWSPDIVSRYGGMTPVPFVNAAGYPHTLLASALQLKTVETATGVDVQVWLTAGYVIDTASFVLTFNPVAANLVLVGGAVVNTSGVGGWSWMGVVTTEASKSYLELGAFNGNYSSISSSSDILLNSISFTLVQGSCGFTISLAEPSPDISHVKTALEYLGDPVAVGTLPILTYIAPPAVALATDNGSSASDGITNVGTVTVTGFEANATWEYSTDGGTNWIAGTGTSFTLSAGTHTAESVQARQKDVAGNLSSLGKIATAITVDTTVPTTTLSALTLSADTGTSGTDFITNNASQTISGTLSGVTVAGEVVRVSTDNGTTWTTATNTIGQNSFSLPGVTLTGSNTLKVQVEDAAGNAGTATSQTYVLDTLAPTVSISSNASAVKVGETATITFTFSEDPGTTFLAGDIITTGGTLGSLSGTGLTRTATFTPTASLASGNASITVANATYTDTAGNNGSAGTTPTISIDTVAPIAIISMADNALKAGETSLVTITFSAVPTGFAVDDITAENGSLGGLAVKAGTNGLVYEATFTPIAGVTAATNKITVGTGWTGGGLPPLSSTDSLNYAVDTVAPSVPNLALTTDTGSSISDGITNVGPVTVTGLEANATWEYSTDGGTSWASGTGSNITLSTGGHNANSVQVRQTDVAGNVSSVGQIATAITVDTAAPSAPTLALTTDSGSSPSDGITNVGTVTVSGMEANATWAYSTDGGANWIAGTGSSFMLSASTHSADSVQVRQTDLAGNVSTVSKISTAIIVDATAPAASTVAEKDSTDLSDHLMNNSEAETTAFRVTLPTTGSTAEASDSVELLLNEASFTAQKKVTLTGQNITNGYVDFTVLLADLGSDGAKALISKITDAAGNSGAASSAVSFTLDTTAPANTISGIHVGSGNTAVDGMLSAELVTGETLWAAIGSNPLEDITNSSVSAKTIAWVTAVPAGDTTVKFEVRDAAGNATSRSAGIAGNITTTTTTISDTGSATLTAPDGNPIPAAVLVTGSSNEQILLAAMPPGLSLVVKEIANSADTTLDAKLTDSLNALPTSEVNVNAVQAGIDSYLATLLPGDQANVVVRTIEFPASTELLSAPTANQLVINGSTAGNEALVIDTRNLPDGSVLDLQNVEFAIIIGDNVTIRGGAGSNVVYAGSGRQDIKLGVLDDTIHGGAGDDTIASTSGDDWLYGDDGNDSVSGGDDDDHLFGGANNDTLNGEAGNDTLEGGDGDDNIDGGAGSSDKAVFSGYFSDYTITRLDATHFKIVDTKASDGDDGTDIITNVEYFQFLNGTYNQDNAVDTTPPTLESVSPDNSGIAVAVGSNLVFTFSENVQTTGGVVVHVGSVTGEVVPASATVSGKILTIDPVSDLSNGTHYYVTFADGSVHDLYGHSYSAGTYDFTTAAAAPVLHDLTGAVTFWKTGVAMTDVTSAFTSTPVTAGIQFVEFRNIQVSADGARTLEIWETSTKTNSNSLQLEFALPTGSVATWQNDSGLPSGWTSLINTGISGKFVLGGMGITALSAGTVKLGTLMLTAPVNPQHFDLSLRTGWLGNDSVPLFGVALDSMTTGADGICQHINMPDGTYVLTSAKGSGLAEADAVTAIDALAALKMAVGMNPNTDGSAVSSYQFLAADVNKDGIIRAADALNILKMAVKLDSAPAQEWLFVPEIVGSESMSRNQVIWPDNPIPVSLDVDQDLHLIGIVKGDVDGSWAVG
jgi:large repetitive protein